MVEDPLRFKARPMAEWPRTEEPSTIDDAIAHPVDWSIPVAVCPACRATRQGVEVKGISVWVACPDGHISARIKLAPRRA